MSYHESGLSSTGLISYFEEMIDAATGQRARCPVYAVDLGAAGPRPGSLGFAIAGTIQQSGKPGAAVRQFSPFHRA